MQNAVDVAQEVLKQVRTTIVLNMRFMDMAVFRLRTYPENVTLATIIASGYFNSVKTLMNTGDIILINGSNGSTIKVASVVDGVVSLAALS